MSRTRSGCGNLALTIVAPIAVVACCGATAAYAFLLRRRRSQYPNWDEIGESETIKVGGSAKGLDNFCNKKQRPVDYIVVGSGLGGLACASLLCKAGYRVIVLEQHDVAGGSTHTFEERVKGSDEEYSFDVGVHYLGEDLSREGFFSKTAVRRLFDAASDGKLEWCPCDKDYDHAVDLTTGTRIAMPANDPEEKIRRLAAAFPGNEDAIRRYRRACKVAKTVSAIPWFVFKLLPERWNRYLGYPLLRRWYDMYAGRSARDVMERCGLSPEAIGGCSYNFGDFGLPASRLNFLSMAMLELHYDAGGSYPRGGSRSIAKTIVAAIQRRGGGVFVRAPVSEILLEEVDEPWWRRYQGRSNMGPKRYRTTGVRCRGVDLRARLGVISNAGAMNTYGRLLPKDAAAAPLSTLRSKPGAYEPSASFAYLFVGLDGTDDELGLPASNLWLFRGWDHDKNWEEFEKAETYDDLGYLPAVFVSFGSAKDDDCRRRGAKATLQVLAPVKYEWFDDERWNTKKVQNRGKEYLALKQVWINRLLEYLYDQFPQCRGRVAFSDLATPLTTNFYLNTVRGENYGLAHTVARFDADVQAGALHTAGPPNIDGLYLVGQDAACVGVVSALGSGLLTSTHLSKIAFTRTAIEMLLG